MYIIKLPTLHSGTLARCRSWVWCAFLFVSVEREPYHIAMKARTLLFSMLVLILLFVSSCKPETVHPDYDYDKWIEENRNRSADIVFIGDSRVAGCAWEEIFTTEERNVLNLGVGGEKTNGVTKRLEVLETIQPKVLIISIGGNDAASSSFTAMDFTADYRAMLERIHELGLSMNVYTHNIVGFTNSDYLYANDRFTNCNTIIMEMSLAYGCEFLDIASIMNESGSNKGNSAYMAQDGIHFSGEGNRVWADFLREKVPELN